MRLRRQLSAVEVRDVAMCQGLGEGTLLVRLRDVYRRFAYPLLRYDHGLGLMRRFRFLAESQWHDGERLEDLRLRKLRQLMEHCCLRVPFYRDHALERGGIRPEEMQTLSDLRRLPVMSKESIRGQGSRMRSSDWRWRRAVERTTGGSTGRPFRFLKDRNSVTWSEACKLRGKSWAGARVGDREVYLGFLVSPSLLGRVRSWLLNSYALRASEEADSTLEILSSLSGFNPVLLDGYASVLHRLALTKLRNQVDGPSIPIVMSTGEILQSHQRAILQEVFGGKVYDYYGCSEVSGIAFECEYGRKHVCSEHVIVEVVDGGGNSVYEEPGAVVVTDLDNYAMPFVRYMNGDIAVMAKPGCRCGRSSSVVEEVLGRSADVVRLGNGDPVYPSEISRMLGGIEGVRRCQLEQHSPSSFSVGVVWEGDGDEERAQEIQRRLGKALGGDARIVVLGRDSIPLTELGKERLVVSALEESGLL